MATLKNEVRAFIVQAIACFDTPSQVAQAVRQEFGIELSRQQCEAYDPTKYAGRNLGKRWQILFHDTRKRFREETADIPIANRAYRLRAMARLIDKAEKAKNLALALQVLEQAAKEVGDAYVNRRMELTRLPGTDAAAEVTVYVLRPDEDVPPDPHL